MTCVIRVLALSVVAAAIVLVLIPATATQVPPSSLRVGNQSLAPASCATRDTLWIHHYMAALYVPARESPVIALQDPKRAKALQVQILNKSFLPRELPKKWRRTLEEQLDQKSLTSVGAAWKELSVGDRVTIAYVPGPGVSLKVNDRLVATTPNHQLIEAMLRTWAEGETVSERVTRTVAKHPCRL